MYRRYIEDIEKIYGRYVEDVWQIKCRKKCVHMLGRKVQSPNCAATANHHQSAMRVLRAPLSGSSNRPW